ncbi:MAG: hypothetical protein ABIS14_06140 [Sphingomonas sp.]
MDRLATKNARHNAETFARDVQGDMPFEKLFVGARRRQHLLAELGRVAAEQAIGDPHRLLEMHPVSGRLIAQAVRSPGGRLLVIDPGQKGRRRAREKLRTRYHGAPAGALADDVRIMAIPSSPQLGDAMAAVLKLRFRHHDTGWRVRPSGHFSRAVYIELQPGYVGEVAFQNAGQYRSGNRSHPLYEVVRAITGPDHSPGAAHAPALRTCEKVARRCNAALRAAGLGALGTFGAADFGPDSYWRTYYSLLRIVQDIHEGAVARASYARREIYYDCVSTFNAGKAYADRLRVA